MLKSTYKPSPGLATPSPLLPGWTEHKAPSGHTYYYNAATKESTYTRPGAAPGFPSAAAPPPPPPPPQVNLSDPSVANAFMAQYNPQPFAGHRGGRGAGGRGRGGAHDGRPRPQPADKPVSKVAIPGCEPWVLVYTKCSRRFVYNPDKKASYWRIPEKLMAGILELDKARIREKAGIVRPEDEQKKREEEEAEKAAREQAAAAEAEEKKKRDEERADPDYDSDDYEEVEVTDDEGEEGEDGHVQKRQRTEESAEDDQPVEFSEADIAFQLQAMGGDYAMDEEQGYPGEEEEGDWAEQPAISDEDAQNLFKDLLNDFKISPYSPWDKLIEEGKVFDDPRYTVLPTMKARRDVWDEWSREKIKELKEQRAKQEKKNPKIPYMSLLQEKATPKLYWPEFRRKYKKESAMKDPGLADKDREKWYREHISRLKLPQSTLKADLTALLKSLPVSKLNKATVVDHLPADLLTDIRYISLDPKTRDALVEAYVQTLPPPPEDLQAAEDDESARKAREDRRRREDALRERERAVAEEKRRQQRRLEASKAVLREEERELRDAMQVGKRGLQSQLAGAAGTAAGEKSGA